VAGDSSYCSASLVIGDDGAGEDVASAGWRVTIVDVLDDILVRRGVSTSLTGLLCPVEDLLVVDRGHSSGHKSEV
jgi:hypothetical protein